MENRNTERSISSQRKRRASLDQSDGYWVALPAATSGLVIPLVETLLEGDAAENPVKRKLLVLLFGCYCLIGLLFILASVLEG